MQIVPSLILKILACPDEDLNPDLPVVERMPYPWGNEAGSWSCHLEVINVKDTDYEKTGTVSIEQTRSVELYCNVILINFQGEHHLFCSRHPFMLKLLSI